MDVVQGAPEPTPHYDAPHSVEESNNDMNAHNELTPEPNENSNENDNPIVEHGNVNEEHEIENDETNLVSNEATDTKIENDESNEPVIVSDHTHEDLVHNNTYINLEEHVESNAISEPETTAATIEVENAPQGARVEEAMNEVDERNDTEPPQLRRSSRETKGVRSVLNVLHNAKKRYEIIKHKSFLQRTRKRHRPKRHL